ncbi:hypothetical protein QE627_06235 [Streptococcus suis]|uniref:mucin-binding protein n=1 Tax=Streptococcus suis TaxID=1307 RepID=UPI00375715BF
MTYSQQMVTVSVMDIDRHVEVAKKTIESPQDYDHAKELAIWLNKGYTVENITTEEVDSEVFITLYLKERVVLVLPSEPKVPGTAVDGKGKLTWPEGVAEADLVNVFERILSFTYEDGRQALPPVVQQIVLSRTAMFNFVTEELTYLPWRSSTGNKSFPLYSVQELPGFTPSEREIPAIEVLSLPTNQVSTTIVYRRSTREIPIQVVDEETGAILAEDTFNGKTGDVIRYPAASLVQGLIAKGYEVVRNDLESSQYIHAEGNVPIVIQMRPVVMDIDVPTTYPAVGERVYPEMEDSIVWPSELGEEELHREVQRTVHFYDEEGEVILEPIHQVAHFYRRAQWNLVTGHIYYGPWEGETTVFPAVEAPKISGYLAKPLHIPAWNHLSPMKQNRIESITYSKIIQKILIKLVLEEDGVELDTIQLFGKAGDPIHYRPDEKIQTYLAAGYELVSNDYPTEGIFGVDDGEENTYQIILRPRLLTVMPNQPKKAGTVVDENSPTGPFWPKGVTEEELKRTVHRRIRFLYENGEEAFPDRLDMVSFSRSAQVNLVSGLITYQPWDHNHLIFEEITPPEHPQFYADHLRISSTEVTPYSAHQEITVYYSERETVYTLRIFRESDGVLLRERKCHNPDTEEITRVFNQMLLPLTDAGYCLPKKHKKLEIQYQQIDTELTLYVRSVKEKVTIESPKEAFSTIEGYPRLSWPSGLEMEDLTKTVTRTIYFQCVGHAPFKEERQVIHFSRHALVEIATGEITYGQWTCSTSSGFDKVLSPDLDDFDMEVGHVPAKPSSLITENEVVHVYYRPKVGNIHIDYQSEHGSLGKEVLTGMLGEEVSHQLLTFPGYEILTSDCPSILSFSEQELHYTVTLRSKVMTVDYEHPLPAYRMMDLDGCSTMVPVGLESHDLTYINQRVIRFLSDTGQTLFPDIVQESRVSRTAELNLATQSVRYGEWEVEAPFPEVRVPDLIGYETQRQLIPEYSVTPTGEKLVFNEIVRYYSCPYRFYIRIIDVSTLQVLEELQLVIRTGEEAPYNLEQLVDIYKDEGYELLETKVVGEEDYYRDVELYLQARIVEVHREMIENDYQELPLDLAQYLRRIPHLTLHHLERKIRRTICYLNEEREEVADSYIGEVLFEREAAVNLTTGEVSFGDWYSRYPIFDAIVPPLVIGYQSSQEFIPSITLESSETADILEELYYFSSGPSTVVDVSRMDEKDPHIGKDKSSTDRHATQSDGKEVPAIVTKIKKQSLWARLKKLFHLGDTTD